MVARSNAALAKLKRTRESSNTKEILGIVPKERNLWSIIIILFRFFSFCIVVPFLSPPLSFLSTCSIFIRNQMMINHWGLRGYILAYVAAMGRGFDFVILIFFFLCTKLTLLGWNIIRNASVFYVVFSTAGGRKFMNNINSLAFKENMCLSLGCSYHCWIEEIFLCFGGKMLFSEPPKLCWSGAEYCDKDS